MGVCRMFNSLGTKRLGEGETCPVTPSPAETVAASHDAKVC